VHRLVLLLAAGLFALAAVPALAQSGAAYGGPFPNEAVFTPAECRTVVGEALEERTEVTCGRLSVPERWEDAGSRRIDLAVVVYKAEGPRIEGPAGAPVVYLHGGPGGHVFDRPSFGMNSPFRTGRDLIVFEQRGVHLSSDFCPEAGEDYYDLLAADVDPDAYGARYLALGLSCREEAAAAGVDLGAYTTLENAHDVKGLREALGFEQWHLWGISYGTELAQAVLRIDAAGVRAAILDSVVPAHVNWLGETGPNFGASLETLYRACSEDPACAKAFPDLPGLFEANVRDLIEEPTELRLGGETFTVNANEYVSVVHQLLYSSATYPALPLLLHESRDADRRKAIFGNMIPLFRPRITGFSRGTYDAMTCSGIPTPSALPEDIPELPGPVWRNFFLPIESFAMCTALAEVPKQPDAFFTPLVTDVPVLTLGGGWDPITPARWAEEVAQNQPTVRYIYVPYAGHGVTLESGCALAATKDFLTAPEPAVSLTCAEDPPLRPFLTNVAFAPAAMTLALELNSGGGPLATGLLAAAVGLLFALIALSAASVQRLRAGAQRSGPGLLHFGIALGAACLMGLGFIAGLFAAIEATAQSSFLLLPMGLLSGYAWVLELALITSIAAGAALIMYFVDITRPMAFAARVWRGFAAALAMVFPIWAFAAGFLGA